MTQIVYDKKSPETIQAMFGSIAKYYDRGNALLSFNMHRLWNRALVHEIRGSLPHGDLLDLCCGTGEIGLGYLQHAPAECHLHLLDFCEEMLHFARAKVQKASLAQPTSHIHYIHGDAQEVPLENESVDFVTVAYGIRNVKDPARCCREAFRVLKPGGRFGILELTRPSHPFLRQGHRIYLGTILPILGRLAAANGQAYQYLRDSIENFINPNELKTVFEECCFEPVWTRPLMGGIATIIVGSKPR